MALTSATLQTIFASPAVASRARSTYLLPRIASVPRISRNAVRCMATGEDEKVKPMDSVTSSSTPTPPPPTTTTSKATPIPPTPKPKAKVSTKFGDVFAFSGPAPERINGRLAMVGFVAALAVELSKGQDVFTQISEGGASWFLLISGLFTVASLIPMFGGVTAESKSDGLMTSEAEIWNGRFAMLGLVALAFTEYVKGGPFV
ncbi:Early light-induced protein 2, chloroplastic [Linum grandiflorum]